MAVAQRHSFRSLAPLCRIRGCENLYYFHNFVLSIATSVAWLSSHQIKYRWMRQCANITPVRHSSWPCVCVCQAVWKCQIRAHTKAPSFWISRKSVKCPKYASHCHRSNNTDRHIKSNLLVFFLSIFHSFDMTKSMNLGPKFGRKKKNTCCGRNFQCWHLFIGFRTKTGMHFTVFGDKNFIRN